MTSKTETTYKVFTTRGSTEYPEFEAAVAAARKTAKSVRREIVIIQDQHTPGYFDGIEVARWSVSPSGAVEAA